MRNATKTHYIFLSALLFSIVAACTNSKRSIPFPEAMERPQPVAKPLAFTEPTNLSWPEGTPVKPVVKKFDLMKLPSRPFDSSGFIPFSKQPEVVPFDFDKLPDTAFNYDYLPSKPLKYEVSVLEPPQLIKTSLHLKTSSPVPLYELGEPFTGRHIRAVFEDSKGFLWISDEQRLYRYDGQNLLYFHDFLAQTQNIVEDSRGQIWIATLDSGLYVINQRSAIVKHLTVNGGLISNGTYRVIVDKKDRAWVTCSDNFNAGVCIIDEGQHEIKNFGIGQGLSISNPNHIPNPNRILQDDRGNIWILTFSAGVNVIDLKNGKLKYLDKRSGLISDSTNKIMQDETGRIWISDASWISDGSGAINAIDVKAGSITHYSTNQGLPKGVWNSSLLSDGEDIYIATNQNAHTPIGIRIINPERKQFKILSTTSGLNSNDVYAVLKDRRGQIWIGTSTGLNMIKQNGTNMEHTGNRDVTALAQDQQGRIWVGLINSGIEIVDLSTRSIRSLTTANGLINDTIQNVRLIDGKMCIMTSGGVDMFDSNFTTITHLGKEQGLTYQGVTAFSKDALGRFWIANSSRVTKGIDVYNPKKNIVQHLGLEQGMKDSIVLDVGEDHRGNIWFTRFFGSVGVIDSTFKILKYIKNVQGLDESVLKPLLVDSHGNVWIGTSKGIYIINSRTDSITSITANEGLINNNIISFNEYKGHIYAGTRGGLTIITPPFLSRGEKWAFESFGVERGFAKNTGSWESDAITHDGSFLWGDAGITALIDGKRFHPSPQTAIAGIDVFNSPLYFSEEPWKLLDEKDTLKENNPRKFYMKDQLPSNISFLHQNNIKYDSVSGFFNNPVNLSLPYDQNFLQFHFVQVNGDQQDTTWYRYILEGADKNWSSRTLNISSKNYYALAPGSYTFKVASLFNGKWTKPGEFSFVILPPWWQTWWAYSLFVLAIFAIVYVAVHYRSRKLKAANLALEEKINQRTFELKQSLQELKATQTQLIQSEKMASLGELTAGIAHEIQNPLNFVNNFSEVNNEMINEAVEEINKGNIDEVKIILNDIKENSEKINHHGKRADVIVKGMLQHSRLSTGQKEPTDINKLADEYLRLAYHGLRAKDKSFNAGLKADFDEGIGKINIVPQDVGRVLLNLFNNAFYAVNEKTKQNLNGYEPLVIVSTTKHNGKIELSVKDNGNGIPDPIKEKIFQPFFTTKPTGSGTGLGLSLSYDIVKAHNGEIEVETKEGEGSEFIVRLPFN